MAGCLPDYWKRVARGREFHVQAVAREARDAAISRTEAVVQRQGGDVLDFKMFSDLAINLIVEASGDGVARIVDELAALGWSVELEPTRELLAARAADRLEGTLQLTFPQGSGELKVTTPAVPG
jgi:hypothetical protein